MGKRRVRGSLKLGSTGEEGRKWGKKKICKPCAINSEMFARVSKKDENSCRLCFFTCSTLRLDHMGPSCLTAEVSGSAVLDKQHSPARPPRLLYLERESQICGEKELSTPAKASWAVEVQLAQLHSPRICRAHQVPLHKALHLPHTVSSCPRAF